VAADLDASDVSKDAVESVLAGSGVAHHDGCCGGVALGKELAAAINEW
jgi:hypothetical protein